MAAPAVGGFIGGWMAGEQHQQDMAVNDLALKQAQLKYQSDLDELDAKKQMAEIASKSIAQKVNQGVDLPQALLDTSYVVAAQNMANGNFIAGLDIVNKTADTVKTVADTRIKAAELHLKNLESLHANLAYIDGPEAWDEMFTRLYTENPDADPQLASMAMSQIGKYSPKYLEFMQRATMSELDKVKVQETNARTSLIQSQQVTEKFRRDALVASAEERRARAKHIEKVGVTTPPIKTEQVKAALDLIGSQYEITELNKSALTNVAREVAARALELQGEQGLSATQARKQAVEEAVATGRLSGFKPARMGPGSQAKPLTAPADKSFRPGNWYTGAPGSKLEGQTVFFDGKQFLTQEEMSALSSADLGTADEEVDEPDNYPDEGEE